MEEEGVGVMRCIKSGRSKMMIRESEAKKQGRIASGRYVVMGINKYRINEDKGDDGDDRGRRRYRK